MSQGNAIIVAATILGLSLLAGSYLLVRSIDGATREFGAMAEIVAGLDGAAAAGAPAAAPAPRRGLDPDKVYAVNVAGSPVKGPEDAKVTLVEFSDFQCPFCSRVTPTLAQIREAYPDEVRIVFKHLPLRIHPKAPLAHAAAEAAKGQGKFWEMHDKIFADQSKLDEDTFVAYAKELGLDVERFRKDLASKDVKARVDADVAEAAKLGVTGTPGFFINGRFVSGAKPFAEFEKRIDEELAKG